MLTTIREVFVPWVAITRRARLLKNKIKKIHDIKEENNPRKKKRKNDKEHISIIVRKA